MSEGQRSKARIPGMLALCSPCTTQKDARLVLQARKCSKGNGEGPGGAQGALIQL